VGKVLLDFTGSPASDTRVEVKMAVGGISLRLPRAAGVRISMDKFLASFDATGLIRRSGAFVSPNYDKADRKLDIELTTAIGGVDVEWVE
jgi:predicted membrane protein